jgi:hypothetical protein
MPTQSSAASAEDEPENRANQVPANMPSAQPFGPPPTDPGEPTSVLLPAEEIEQLPQKTFEDSTRTPKPLFLQQPLTLAFQTCLRFVQECPRLNIVRGCFCHD